MNQVDRNQWTEPGADRVAPGIHRVPLPLPMDGLRAVNVYAIETDQGLTCIDAGWAIEVSRTQFEESLKTIGYSVRDINRFLVTHVHRDHYTQAVTIRREFGNARIDLGLGDKPTIDLFNSGDLDADPTVARLVLGGAFDIADGWRALFDSSEPDSDMWAPPDNWLDGDHLLEVGGRTIRAVPTPGHTAGHFVFLDEAAGVLFGGDHVLSTITPSVGFELVFEGNPLGAFLASLQTVRGLPDLKLLPAHGPVMDSTHQRVDELLAHHDERLELCAEAVSAEGSTAHDVAQLLTWTRHERLFTDLDMFNSAMASMETMVHLDLLAARGVLTREVTDGTATYHPIKMG